MENEMEKDTALTFGVGLNKTEYVIFQKTMTKFVAGKRVVKVITLLLTVFILLTAGDIFRNDPERMQDPVVVVSFLVFAVLLGFWIFLPKLIENRRFAKGYEDAVAGGQVFDGMVTVNTDGITKVTESGSVILSFDRDLLFIERQEMLIFVNRFGQGIVLPARCLTKEDAAAVRFIAQRYINPRFYVSKGRLQPTATARLELMSATPPAVLYTFAMQYEEKERKALLKTVIKRDIFRSAPLYFLFCFLLSASAGLDNGFTAATVTFWVAVALFAVLKALFWVPRYKRTDRDNGVLTVTLNEHAVVVEKKTETVPQKVILQWRDIAHAVEGEDAVEIYNKRQYVYIPKRCVGDMDFLRSIVNDKMKGNQ